MVKLYKTIFQLRRGLNDDWVRINPVLREGEPGFVTDRNRLKIGDGVTPWNELPYSDNGGSVKSYPTHFDFPNVGEDGIIYKATQEQKLYQWNEGFYETLNGADIPDINTIYGGDAYGTRQSNS